MLEVCLDDSIRSRMSGGWGWGWAVKLHVIRAAELREFVPPCPMCGKARRLVGRNRDLAIYGCPIALDAVTGHGATDEDHEHYMAAEFTGAPVLAAMAEVPAWLLPFTLGRPAWSYAVGDLRPLLWSALGERERGVSTERMDAYRAAMDARWSRCVDLGRFAPGAWAWAPHEDVTTSGIVPDGAAILCTCKPGTVCHTDWIRPHLERAGWALA